MRTAEQVLGIINDRGKQSLPLEDIYRQLYNPHLYLRAYDRLRVNKGAMTPGVTGETVDGMSLEKIGAIIEDLRFERFRWTPVRRTYIPKKSGKLRALGIPTWSNKLLQEVMRSILEAYYEPQFSTHSHGFRPNKGCHSALASIQRWKGMHWFIEGDITKCFDRLDHHILLSTMREQLHDNRFLRLVEGLLTAGYLEEWRYHATYSGSPQGGVISPILSNIYLDRLDKYVERVLVPAHTRGERRAYNPEYVVMTTAIEKARKSGNAMELHSLHQQRRQLPSKSTNDPGFRRLHYVRYADDFLLGFAGPKAEAEDIKADLQEFLAESLHLALSAEKTLITHARSDAARFLSYDIRIIHADDRLDPRGHRTANSVVELKVPQDVIDAACQRYTQHGKSIHRAALVRNSDYAIVHQYQDEYRGLVQYYVLASNVSNLNKVRYTAESSLLKTLANKHRSTLMAMRKRYRATIETPYGDRLCLRVEVPRGEGKKPLMATFGGIPLHRKKIALLSDNPLVIIGNRTDIVTRLLRDTCEMCGRKGTAVHHVRKLADLRRPGRREKPAWVKRMIALHRKTLVVCHDCHIAIHAGRPCRQPVNDNVTGEPDA